MKKQLYRFSLLPVASLMLLACSHEEIASYSYGRCLYFIRYLDNDKGDKIRVDTAEMSFSNYPKKQEYTQPFYVGLIGEPLTEDLEYKAEIIEKNTTARPEQYRLPERPLFRKGMVMDTLNITVLKNQMEQGEECVLALRLVGSPHFKVGYSAPGDSYTDIRFRFNNKISKPLWWKGDIETVFFGTYSPEKLETIIRANPDFETVENLSSTQIRRIALNTKKYIEANHIVEKDGSKMEIPMY